MAVAKLMFGLVPPETDQAPVQRFLPTDSMSRYAKLFTIYPALLTAFLRVVSEPSRASCSPQR